MSELSPAVRRFDPRLHIMMFMEYAVKGIWIPIAGRFLSAPVVDGGLGFTNLQIGLIIATAAGVGAIAAPFIAGQVADRYFATERCLAVLLITAGVLNIAMAYQTSFAAWLIISVVYSICYMPTVALTNTQAMAHMADPKRQFPTVRLWGTIGWIVPAWAFPMIWLQTDLSFQWLPPFFTGDEVARAPARMLHSLIAAGVMSILYGFYCFFFLPHTPPKRDATDKIAFLKAFAMVRRPSFALLMVCAFLLSITHTIYFIQTGNYLTSIGLDERYILPAMSIGQFAEIGVIAFLGVMLSRLGFRTVLAIGAFCYFLRFAVFGSTFLPLGVIIASQAFHGFCFSCFYAAAYIYVDAIAPRDARHSAQTFFTLVLLGAGPITAGLFNGFLADLFTPEGGTLDFSKFWYTLSIFGLVSAALLALFFRDETPGAEAQSAPSQDEP